MSRRCASAKRHAGGALLVAGIVCAALTEAIAGTALSLGRAGVAGDTHATPDELAWLEIGYTALKLVGFMLAPWLMSRVEPRRLLVGASLAMGLACLVAALTRRLELLVALRAVQGLAGGTLLVAGQAVVFLAFDRARQPGLQALFAVAAVVAPATIAPALQGWLLDHLAWTWIFLGVVPLSLAAAGLLLLARAPAPLACARRPFDWIGGLLLSTAIGCFTCVLVWGSRWEWFEAARIVWLTMVGVAALLAFLARQVTACPRVLLDCSLFRSEDFSFAAVVSLVAGAALFGTAFLIPSFAVSRLGFTPGDAGALLLPSSGLFVGALLSSAWLMQARGLPAIATVPLGIALIMAAMWMLSGSTSQSGAADMMGAVLLRGLGLGFLFLSITMIAFGSLPREQLAAGIALFNTGRQLGGLVGVAALQTLIDHEAAANVAALGANVGAGLPAVGERLAGTAAMLTSKGLDAAAASATSASLLGRAVAGEALVLAFGTAFNAIACLFVLAAPVLIGIKVALRRSARRAGESAQQG